MTTLTKLTLTLMAFTLLALAMTGNLSILGELDTPPIQTTEAK